MNTLKVIQSLSRIGKIMSRIVFVCCIVGFCGCMVGVTGLAFGAETFHLGGVTIHSIIENQAGLSQPVLYASMAVGAVFCASEAVLSKFAETYFRNGLADGDPFTLRGAKELMRLGILTAAIPLGTVIVCSIGVVIAGNFFPEIEKLSFDGYASVGLGIMMIVASLFCRYGAERNIEKAEQT